MSAPNRYESLNPSAIDINTIHTLLDPKNSVTVSKEHRWYGKRCIVDPVTKTAYKLDTLAERLTQELESKDATVEDALKLKSSIEILLQAYKTSSPNFNIFGKKNKFQAQLRNICCEPSKTVHKTTTAFSLLWPFSNPPKVFPVDSLRQAAYEDPAYRRALDHKELSPIEAKLQCLRGKEKALEQFTSEATGELFAPQITDTPTQPEASTILQETAQRLELINADSYNVSTTEKARQLCDVILQIRQNDQNAIILDEQPINILIVTNKLIAAMDLIPSDSTSEKEIKALCHQMLKRLEVALSTIEGIDTQDLRSGIQGKCLTIENLLLSSLSQQSCGRIDLLFATIQEDLKKLKNPELEQSKKEMIPDNIKRVKQQITTLAFEGISFAFSPDDSDGLLETTFQRVIAVRNSPMWASTACSAEAIANFLDPFVDAPVTAAPVPGPNPIYQTSKVAPLGSHSIAFCETRGQNPDRFYMEDQHLNIAFSVTIGTQTYPVELCGIFDGHGDSMAGGGLAASYVQRFYQPMLKKELEKCRENPTPTEISNALIRTSVALHEAWLMYCDQKMEQLQIEQDATPDDNQKAIIFSKKKRLMAGTTSCTLIHINNNWYTANVGDSRIILVSNKRNNTRQITADATPESQKEEIEKRGGTVRISSRSGKSTIVVENNQGGGGCSSGGAIGDAYIGFDTASNWDSRWTISDQGISPVPNVIWLEDEEVLEDDIFILACDGLNEISTKKVASSEQVGNFVLANPTASLDRLAEGITVGAIKAGCQDNCSVGAMRVRYPVSEDRPSKSLDEYLNR